MVGALQSVLLSAVEKANIPQKTGVYVKSIEKTADGSRILHDDSAYLIDSFFLVLVCILFTHMYLCSVFLSMRVQVVLNTVLLTLLWLRTVPNRS